MSNAYNFDIRNGELLRYNGLDEDIAVPDGVTTIDSYAFRGSGIKSVVLPDGIKIIKHNAFDRCTALNKINIPDTIEEIGDEAFKSCYGLADENGYIIVKNILFGTTWNFEDVPKEVRIPEGVVRISRDTFRLKIHDKCSIHFPFSLSEIGEMAFWNCVGLETIKFPDGLLSIGTDSFQSCLNLKSVSIPESVEHIGENAFDDCPLDELFAPGTLFTGIKGTKMKALAFKTFMRDPSRYQNSQVVASYRKYIISQKKKWLSEILKEDRVDLLQIFSDAKKISSDNIDEEYLKLAKRANATQCTAFLQNLKNQLLSVAKSKKNDVLSGNLFSPANMKKLWSYQKQEDGTIKLTDYKGTDTEITIPERIGSTAVTVLGEYLFSPEKPRRKKEAREVMERITVINIPDSIREIGDYAFSSCKGLTSVTLPNELKEIGEGAFSFCRKIKSINLPNTINRIRRSTFEYCSSLTSIELPKNITIIGESAFAGCENLISITLPDSLSSIEDEVFSNCKKLTKINLTENEIVIGKGILKGCDGLSDQNGFVIFKEVLYHYSASAKEVFVPDGVVWIDRFAFDRNKVLEFVTLPNSITSIEDFAFCDCKNIKSIYLPNGQIRIHDWAFTKCPNLTIHAPADSNAEQYAKEHNIPFVAEKR